MYGIKQRNSSGIWNGRQPRNLPSFVDVLSMSLACHVAKLILCLSGLGRSDSRMFVGCLALGKSIKMEIEDKRKSIIGEETLCINTIPPIELRDVIWANHF